ncbi:hemagglutinin repeat-containing protein [Pseudoxanthomonas mexicana]|nr:hemagglutinin repeat-containing protein [Pseudoxanthomonas mexicana]UOV06924.1 hemagglutinin repeat-containing protein [Pseudoxanthomonas mexicana]
MGSQQSKSEVNANTREVVGSSVNAGRVADITATGAGENSTIRVSGSDVYGGTGTNLTADGAIDIVAAQSTYAQQTENSSAGWNAGLAISAGSNGWSAGITAGGNVGRGGSDGQSVANVNSHVGSGGTTTVTSGGTTTIRGGQVTGDRVELTADKLVIGSLQDTDTFESDQMNASAQVTVGYGASVSGSYSQSKIDANYASVTEQSGILAGDGGYAVNIKYSTDLKGGIVTSTQAAEDADRNSFSTGTLTTSDIENHADYEGSAFGISGSMGKNGKGEQGEHQATQGSPDGKPGGVSANKAIGFGSDGDHQSSITHSGINTANIAITDVDGQAATGKTVDQIKTDVGTATTTDTVDVNSGVLVNKFDENAVQKELDLQVQVTQAFDQNRQEAKAELYARAQAKADEARAIRMANGGVETEESQKLDEEAAGIKKTAMWLDIAAMGIYTGPDIGTLLTGETLTQIDLVRRTATAQNKIVVQQCEASGQNCAQREVDLKDVAIGPDGKIYVFNNGIFNKEEYALATGAKQNSNESNAQGVYYILNPYTGNPVAEMLYAGYDKLNDLLGGTLPLTSAEMANQAIIESAKANGGIVDSVNHSRGGMTWTNAMQDLENQGKEQLPIGSVRYNGAAANALEAANLVDKIDDDRGQVYQSTHPTDIVGRWLGRNPATGEKNDGSFPGSHSSYTGYLPLPNVSVGKVENLREVTDKNWGTGNYSIPASVPPTGSKSSKPKKEGDGNE